jgi:hypothetical protein
MRGIRVCALATVICMYVALQSTPPALGRKLSPSCFGEQATRVGTRGEDLIRGTRKRDVIVALGGDDKVYGLDGNDLICAGGGSDNVEAHYGHDLVNGGSGNDRLDGGPDIDHVSGGEGNDFIYGGVGDAEPDTVVGGSGSDLVKVDGNASNSHLFGGSGGDQLTGSNTYPDSFYPGSDTDEDFVSAGYQSEGDRVSYRLHQVGVDIDLRRESANPSTGDDFFEVDDIEGSLFEDVLVGDEGVNGLIGHDGNDVISALGDNDNVDPGLGDDILDGGEHTPTQYSSGGDALSFALSPVGVDASLVRGSSTGAGNDTFSGFEHIGGSEYSDRLEGDDQANSLGGRGGYNVLLGLGGDDFLHESSSESDAGPGYDTCQDQRGQNCETWYHFDSTSTSAVVFPQESKAYGPTEVKKVEAEARDASSLSPPVDRIRIALRLLTEDGCLWWAQRQADLIVRPCGLPLYNRQIRIDRPLPEGPYTARSKARLSGTKRWITGPGVGFSILAD